MELTYDWKSFQSVFYPQKRSLSLPLENQDSSVIFAVIEQNRVVAAYGEDEDLSDWIGTPIDTLRSSHAHREVVALEREDVDGWIQKSVSRSHLYEQIDLFRKSAAPQLEAKVRNNLRRKACLAEKHFLLNALMGSWSKVLPSSFGVFIRLEKAPAGFEPAEQLLEHFGNRCKDYLDQEQDILILFRGGKLEAFYEPDLNSVGPDRRLNQTEVVRYLSEKHSVPIQGISMPWMEWMSWGHAKQPWRKVAKSLKAKQTKLTPFRWKIASILAVRAAFEV